MELYLKALPQISQHEDSSDKPNPASWELWGLKRENTQLLPSPYPKGRSLGGTPPAEPEGVSLVPRTDFL